MGYSLKFQMKIGGADGSNRSSALRIGVLQLLKNGKVVNEYRATSSLQGRQFEGSWDNTGGLLPPTNILKLCSGKNAFYEVRTNPFFMPNTRGVNGYFYQILPLTVKMRLSGVERGDWGIHADKFNDYQGFPGDMESSSPGTLGCIGLQTGAGYKAFMRDMKEISKVQENIPLEVIYSQ